MSRFAVVGIDHVHIYVRDRAAAARWYGTVLGLRRDRRFAAWAREVGGPLTLTAADGITHVALFEDERRAGHGSTVACEPTVRVSSRSRSARSGCRFSTGVAAGRRRGYRITISRCRCISVIPMAIRSS